MRNEDGALGGGNGRFGVSVGGEDGAFVCVLGGRPKRCTVSDRSPLCIAMPFGKWF